MGGEGRCWGKDLGGGGKGILGPVGEWCCLLFIFPLIVLEDQAKLTPEVQLDDRDCDGVCLMVQAGSKSRKQSKKVKENRFGE